MARHSTVVIYVAIAANSAIAVTKFFVGIMAASSAIISEAIHSVVDTGNQCLLLLGVKRSQKPADAQHPFGYGKELYFWSLIVAILLFGVGGGMAMYEGVRHWLHPEPPGDPMWSYIVLGIAAVFESISFTVAARKIAGGRGRGLWSRLHGSKDPTVFTVYFEDLAALTGLAIAFCGVYLEHRFHDPRFDAAASMLIGAVLAAVALLLVYESRGLLIGESSDPQTVESIRRIATQEPQIQHASTPLTMHLGPEELLVAMCVQTQPGLSGPEQTDLIARIEQKIRSRHPQVKRAYLEIT